MTTLEAHLRRLEIKRLILACSRYDMRVCPTKQHQRYWTYRQGTWLCTACLKLSEWIAC